MGSMISLAVGRLEIDWGKNHGFVDHSALFQPSDLAKIPYFYARPQSRGDGDGSDWEIITEMKDGLSKRLSHVIARVNLLGHTAAVCEKEFVSLASLHGVDTDAFPFVSLQNALASVDVNSIDPNYGEGGEDFGKFARREILPRLGLNSILDVGTRFDVAEAMENLSAYTVLHLLALNATARDLNVQWAFNYLEDGGWAKREDFVRPVEQASRFLVVTEGSSDAAIIGKAFQLLKPHIADFFDFVDMQDGYPFSGTGNLFRFVQGLVGIRVLNNVLVVYDNDAEGVANFHRTRALNLPANIRVMKLPDLDCFERFSTVGPNGEHAENINGRAAAIEAYLDLPKDACVRWSSYNDKAGAYQGELLHKKQYAQRLLRQRTKDPDYRYDKISTVLDLLVDNATAMRETVTMAHYIAEYEHRLLSM